VGTQSWRKASSPSSGWHSAANLRAQAEHALRRTLPSEGADDEEEEGGGGPETEILIEETDLQPDSERSHTGEDPDYGDLLDTDWLERTGDVEEVEDAEVGLAEVGFTLDLNGPDDGEELAQIVDLDVGSLLTSLPEDEMDLDGSVRESGADGNLGLGGLSDELLLPEDVPAGERADEVVGDDDRFPAFDDSLAVNPRSPAQDSDEDGLPEDEVPM
jgi:hypothetical protein